MNVLKVVRRCSDYTIPQLINLASKMSTFVSHVSPTTGKVEWSFRDDNYDYNQEIARSSYADMLHDTERNQMYDAALKKAIDKKRSLNEAVHVLDIGTGTGLLSMMAARLGADTVTACEAFTPMAKCAGKIIEENGHSDKIRLIPKRSTDLEVGEGKDLPRRCNILVTEVFDTELIGEGAISTYTHALRHLLERDCIVVPTAAKMFVQLVNSDLVRRWNQIDDIEIPGAGTVTSPVDISRCGGAPSLHDIQLDQLPQNTFTNMTKPLEIFQFDFSGKIPLLFENKSELVTSVDRPGSVDGVLMWWELDMDTDRNIILSCAPRWAHPTPDNMQWRDHWMQAIYYPYNHATFAEGEKVKIIGRHDEYSLWFDIVKTTSQEQQPLLERPLCTCGSHVTFSRSRMGMFSDPGRRKAFLDILKQRINTDSVCLSISDGSLLPIIAARLGAKHVFTLEPHPHCHRFISDYVRHNQLEEKVTVIGKRSDELTREHLQEMQVNLILGEPVFQTSVLPWDNMYFWYAVNSLPDNLVKQPAMLPSKMTISAVCVHFENLWKIRADVGTCEGFDISQFDSLIQRTSDEVDSNVEPQPLWEYPNTAVSPLVTLLEVDFHTSPSDTKCVDQSREMSIVRDRGCNGVALWADFHYGDGVTVSTGPRGEVVTGETIQWDYYTRQGVHLLCHSLESGDSDRSKVTVSVSFIPTTGEITFKFT